MWSQKFPFPYTIEELADSIELIQSRYEKVMKDELMSILQFFAIKDLHIDGEGFIDWSPLMKEKFRWLMDLIWEKDVLFSDVVEVEMNSIRNANEGE